MDGPKDQNGNSSNRGSKPLEAAFELEHGSRHAPWVASIRALGPRHRERIARHLRALDERDRYLRFGYIANDEQIQRYVDGLNFERDDIFGIYNRKLELIAMAHLAHSFDRSLDACAEFGVSVLKKARGRGYGTQLFERAVKHARNEGVHLMFIHALSENTAMLKIARHAGATIEHDGPDSEAYLRLPPATFDTRVSEMIEEQIAQTDYRLKVQAKQFWDFLRSLQEIRRGVQDARHKSAS
jgi:RimJ/RimL family protein N-acetyltransferase